VSDSVATNARERPWGRHEILRIAPAFWTQAVAPRSHFAAVPLLQRWCKRGWPVIVRRRMVDERGGMLPIGVPLPPSAGKLRIALTVPEASVLERATPPPLAIVKHVADPVWRGTIIALIALGARLMISPASFGSLFWEYATGLRYLSRQSDLDVLWYAHRGCDIASLLTGVAAIERTAPMRIDGEVVFADGGAVNWRELLAVMSGEKPGGVLVKSIDGARLVNVSQLQNLRRAA
jgi:phosphoribosyl-dephospho-CoA transferase